MATEEGITTETLIADGATPKVNTDNTPSPSGGGDAPLGDAGKAALDAERKARTAAEKELKKFRDAEQAQRDKDLPEIDKARREATENLTKAEQAELKALKFEVAYDEGLPKELVGRLVGNTEEELRADAKSLLALVGEKGPKVPKADPSAGRKSTTGNSGLTPAEDFGDMIEDLFSKNE